ncbi:MAG: glycosyltransferase family 1 protein [Candidatus Saccharibacteria bacterium]|nr:glycosyltransferase family 1 protein [Candidatus Saccharibacteria bacterium]
MSKHIVIDARIRRSSTGRYVDRLMEHLQDVDTTNRYTVLIEPDDDWHPKAVNFSTIKCTYPQFSLNPLHQIGFAWQMYRLNPDVAHFLNQQPIFYFGNIVTTTMDLTMLRYTRPGKTPLPIFWIKMAGYRFLFWWSHRKSKQIITISDYVKEELTKKYPFIKGRVTTTHCASEPPLKVESQKLKVESLREPFIFAVGTAFPHKNLERLIKAFEKIHDSRPELKLVLAGKKEYHYEQLEKFADKSPARDNIIFTGFVPDEQLKWLYEHASVYVFPSLSEGFGLPGLEAMAHDLPVASSNATSLPEINGDAAHYFDPRDVDDMAAKITEVLEDEGLRKELIKKGRKQRKKFSWRKMAEQTLGVYRKALRD